MNVSILALTLFTPECSSGYIRRWPTYAEVHSWKESIRYLYLVFSQHVLCTIVISLYGVLSSAIASRKRRFAEICKLECDTIHTLVGRHSEIRREVSSPSQLGTRAPRNIDFSHKTLLTRRCTTLTKHVVSRD